MIIGSLQGHCRRDEPRSESSDFGDAHAHVDRIPSWPRIRDGRGAWQLGSAILWMMLPDTLSGIRSATARSSAGCEDSTSQLRAVISSSRRNAVSIAVISVCHRSGRKSRSSASATLSGHQLWTLRHGVPMFPCHTYPRPHSPMGL